MVEIENDLPLIINVNEKRCDIIGIKSYLLILCLIVLCQSMITSGYISSIVSSLEMYYGYSSEDLGIGFSIYDITGVFVIPLISFFASKYNRARIVAGGAFLFSLGNILFILPYLINGYSNNQWRNSSNETSNYLCRENESFSIELYSSSSSRSLIEYILPHSSINEDRWRYYIILLSMVIMSIGASPFYTLGITYLTDHLKKVDQSMYTSILYGVVALGPAVGFLMGSFFESEWINIGEENLIDGITKNDPRWIGRWWAGFIISSTLLIIFSLILWTFPSRLNSIDEQSTNEILLSEESIHIKNIFYCVMDLLKNVRYLLIVFINSIESILVVSFTTFLVKYIESVLNISSSLSSILIGSIVVPGAIFGTISGGYFVRRYQMNIHQCVRFLLISSLITSLCLISLLFIKCSLNLPYSIENSCSKECHCSSDIYYPVCFEKKISYFSPCHAGCRTILNETIYSNCTCLPEGVLDQVSLGLCEKKCFWISCLFLFILFIITYFETLMATPHLMIVLGSVKDQYQSFGLGFESCLMKVFGQIPTPIIFGIILDRQCLFWSRSSLTNERASCFIYNGNILPYTLFGTTISIKIISFFLLLLLFFITFKDQTNSFSKEEEERPLLLPENSSSSS